MSRFMFIAYVAVQSESKGSVCVAPSCNLGASLYLVSVKIVCWSSLGLWSSVSAGMLFVYFLEGRDQSEQFFQS